MSVIVTSQKDLSSRRNESFFNRPYVFTTENINGYIDEFDLKNKSLLTTGSSADQILNAYLRGAKDVTVFDICPYAKDMFYLKKAAICALYYDEYMKFFSRKNNFQKAFNHQTFDFIAPYFDDMKSLVLWDKLINYYDLIEGDFFQFEEEKTRTIKKINPYLKNEEEYNQLKKIIAEKDAHFISCNLEELPKVLNRKYDNIWLSNIGTYVKNLEPFSKIIFDLENKLTSEGLLLVSYLYNHTLDDKYDDRWVIYNHQKLAKYFGNRLNWHSFTGVYGYNTDNPYEKDSVLLLKKDK